jgi:hypothetical protein
MGGEQALLNIPFNLAECFEGYLSDEYQTFLHMQRVIGEQMLTVIRPYAGSGRIPYQYTPLYPEFSCQRVFRDRKDQSVNPSA